MLKRSSLKIIQVEEGSPGEKAGILPGDRLSEINGQPIHDIIDYKFYSADEVLDCVIYKKSQLKRIIIRLEEGENLGLGFEPMRFRKCGNSCIFCFIDQNPKGMRPGIYFHDEDYRLSFLHGNYVTLTAVTQKDLARIVKQRLSPLYISIHALDLSIRKSMLGLRKDDHLMDKLLYLVQHGIELHGQIVICPGYNDGQVLSLSLISLKEFFPVLRSVAIVPVGLTGHRKGLPRIRGVDSTVARDIVKTVSAMQNRLKKELGEPFVYISDEFYLLSGKRLPSYDHYRELWQIENGVGLTRLFLSEFKRSQSLFPDKISAPQQIIIVTGMMAAPVLKKAVVPQLRKIEGLSVHLCAVPNRFFGDSVTVSGLLTGKDIIGYFQKKPGDSTLVLPPNCVNREGLMLDDMTPDELSRELNRDVRVIDKFSELWGSR